MLTKLKEMCKGDETRIQLYLRTFTNGVPDTIEAIKAELKNKNLKEVRNSVHGIKPLLMIMGFDDVWEKANHIEVTIDSNSDVPHVLTEVEDFIGLLNSSLDKINELI